jgi:hypothetical protein
MLFFLKTNVMIKIFQKVVVFEQKNANISPIFFGENIFKITTSTPGHTDLGDSLSTNLVVQLLATEALNHLCWSSWHPANLTRFRCRLSFHMSMSLQGFDPNLYIVVER